jgi:hypothetical protein
MAFRPDSGDSLNYHFQYNNYLKLSQYNIVNYHLENEILIITQNTIQYLNFHLKFNISIINYI